MSEVEWWRLKAAELNALAARHPVTILPVGSTEQHGPHLPTQVDTLIVSEIARRAARLATESTPVVVAPTVWSGLAEHHVSLGGTFSLDIATFHSLLRGLCRSLVRAGFRRILILNGHGGNIAATAAIASELGAELDVPIAATTYWLLAREAFAGILERQTNVRHACEAETSMMLALVPELVDMKRAAEAVGPTGPELSDLTGPDVVRYRSFAARSHHGAIGDPRAASSEKGERLLDAAAASVAAVVVSDGFWRLPA